MTSIDRGKGGINLKGKRKSRWFEKWCFELLFFGICSDICHDKKNVLNDVIGRAYWRNTTKRCNRIQDKGIIKVDKYQVEILYS